MRKIFLSGKFKDIYTLVDDEDYKELKQWKWYLSINGYVVRNKFKRINGKPVCTTFLMSRQIMGFPQERQVDHINRNKLDNRKTNLRIVDQSTNLHNTGLRQNNSTGYKGIYYHKVHQNWEAKIRVNNKRLYLGSFKTPHQAALAYKQAERVYYKHLGLN